MSDANTSNQRTATSNDDGQTIWTVGKLLTWTADYLKRRKSESPRLDAEVLLAHVLDWTRVQLYTHYEEEIGERSRATYRELVRRRAEGAPVAYLVGHKEFYSLSFRVSPSVLIPRPDTEFLVVEFLARFKTIEAPRCIDVGTGSGCLAIACANHHKTAVFTAVDISQDALDIAKANAKTHRLDSRITFLKGDLLKPVDDSEPFDAILSNPPYIATKAIDELEPGVRDHEPRIALDGGVDGLQVVGRLIEQARSRLKPGGSLLLEIGSDQEAAVRSLLEQSGCFSVAPTICDHANHPRVISAVLTTADDDSQPS